MGLFGINDKLSTFALTKAKRAERKALEIESATVTSILSELDTLNNVSLILSQEIDNLESKVSQIETTLSNLNTLFNNVSLILSQEIDNLESKVSQIETTLSNLNTLFNNIKNTVDDLVVRVGNLENI